MCDSNEFYIHSVWAAMTACRDIRVLDQMDAALLEKDDWEWLGPNRTKPFGLHLRATRDYVHKDRCPRHEDPRLHPELPESPYDAFFPIPSPIDLRTDQDPKFDRLPIASYSTGFNFGKNKSLLNLSGCFNLPSDQTGGMKPQSAQSKRFGKAFHDYPECKMVRSQSETVFSQPVPLDIRGRNIKNVLRKNSNASNEPPPLERKSSYGSVHSPARIASKNSSKRPSVSSSVNRA